MPILASRDLASVQIYPRTPIVTVRLDRGSLHVDWGRTNCNANGLRCNKSRVKNHLLPRMFALMVLLLAGLPAFAEPSVDTSLPVKKPVRNALPSKAADAKKSYTFTEAMGKSIWGDVYAHPEDWQELSYGDFFSKGWDQPWVSPPDGAGGAPRQGWLLAFEGGFLSIGDRDLQLAT